MLVSKIDKCKLSGLYGDIYLLCSSRARSNLIIFVMAVHQQEGVTIAAEMVWATECNTSGVTDKAGKNESLEN